MQTVLYDGSFDGWLSAVFDVYDYKFTDVDICPQHRFLGNVFGQVHIVTTTKAHSERVWKGLEKKLSYNALQEIHRTFLSELPGIETALLQYVQYAFSIAANMETDFSNAAVVTVTQTAKKVWREKHRMEAFVRFQQTKDNLYYAIIEPDYNVLPLISDHFKNRYADQRWLIYDAARRWGIYYDLTSVSPVEISFNEITGNGKNGDAIYNEEEDFYQQLWQQYFKSVNIKSRKNTKLHIKHMPVRYWKYLPEKRANL